MIFVMAFLGAITPGPDMLLILQTTILSGLKRALITLCGIASGWVIYLAILYLGFASFLQNNFAQILLSAFGAIYLAYLSFLLFTKKGNDLGKDLGVESLESVESTRDSKNLAQDSKDFLDSKESIEPAILLDSTKSIESAESKTRDSIDSVESAILLDSTNFRDSTDSRIKSATTSAPSLKSSYLKGLFINLSNPKAIIFFSVIVAPFMDKNLFINLIVLFCGLSCAFFVVIALGLFARKFITNALFDLIDKVCGVVFLGFSAILVWRIMTLAREIL